MKNALIFVLGLILIAGAVGGQDFYDECKAAAHCAAVDPPSMFLTIVYSIVGIVIMGIGVVGMIKEND